MPGMFRVEVVMKSLKGTQTEKNILTAFAGESQARNRYDYFASKAKEDGYVFVRDIFTETALQEKNLTRLIGTKQWVF